MPEAMTKEQIFQQVSEILVQSFELDPDEILLSAHLIDDLDLDSIDAIDLAVGLQDETGLDVAEEELREIRRVEDIVELVHRRLQDV